MRLALVLAVAGFIILSTVVVWRWSDARVWRRSLVAYRLRLPANLDLDDVARWLRMVAAATHGTQWSLFTPPPLALELVATSRGIAHYLLLPGSTKQRLLDTLRAGLPGVRLEEAPDFLTTRAQFDVAGEFTMTSRSRPLSAENGEATSHALLAALHPGSTEEVRLQWIMVSAGTPAPIPSPSAGPDSRPWLDVSDPDLGDTEAIRAARIKQQDALLQVVIRLGVSASSRPLAYRRFGSVWSAAHGLNAVGVRLVRRWLPSIVVSGRIAGRRLPLGTYPLLLNARELAGLIAFPVGRVSMPGLALGTSRQLAPAPGTPTTGTVLADSHSGSSRPLALTRQDRARHLYVLGPTGTGKSTLLGSITLQDIERGDAVVLIDPKADLVEDVLARLPAHRHDDVIVLDPAATARPVGFNLLGNLRTEAERELAVDHVVHIMASLWKDSWGPRSSDITRSGLLTLASTRTPDGSPFTLVELPELLTNKAFRLFVTGQRSVPAVLRPFWFAFDQMSDGERANVVAAPLNKLRALSTRSALRLLLGQSQGIDLGEVLQQRRILLVKLNKGQLGAEAAQLVGSILLATLWKAILARSAMPAEQRRPVHVLIDEFQDVLRLPLDIADFLAQARGLNASMTLANQTLSQLPEAVRAAALGTARSSVVFQLDHDDAAVMQRRYAPLTTEDLMALPAYEVALRLSMLGQTQPPVTGVTRPLPAPTFDASELAGRSQARYGLPRADVEAALTARITPPGSAGSGTTFGRRVREEPRA